MKNIISILLLCFLIFANNSCKEKDPFENKTIIEGYILEYGSDKPLPNVKIYMSGLVNTTIGEPETWILVDSVLTDVNGYVNYEYNHNQVSIDRCTYQVPSKYYTVMSHAINAGTRNDISRFVDPFAWINIHLDNSDLGAFYDQLSISGGWGGGSNNDMFYGFIDTTITRMVRGNKDTELRWRLERNNEVTITDSLIFIPAHDTISVEIQF